MVCTMSDKEERLKRRAYQMWEDEGQPEGRHQQHWRRAEEEDLTRQQEATEEKPPVGAMESADRSDLEPELTPSALRPSGARRKAL
jgi:hypothetical protein